MSDLEFIIEKSPEECLEIIRKKFPNYDETLNCDDIDNWKSNVYTYRAKKDYCLFYANRISVPTVTIKGYFKGISENKTKFTGSFKMNIFIRVFLWVASIVLILGGGLVWLGILIESKLLNKENLPQIIFSIFLIIIPTAYLIYLETTIKKEKNNLKKHIRNALTSSVSTSFPC